MRCLVKTTTVLLCIFFASVLGTTTALNAAEKPKVSASVDLSADTDFAPVDAAKPDLERSRIAQSYGDLPLSFEENRGQSDQRVRFLSRGAGYTFFLTPGEAVLAFSQDQAQSHPAVLRLQLAGSNADARIGGADPLPGSSNYFLGQDPVRWRTGVPTYRKVAYENIYPGINLVYYGNQRQLEYDFVVAPGADPRRIRLAVQGAGELTVDAEGNLVLGTSGGEVRLLAPRIYQDVDGRRREIAGQWNLKGRNSAGFQLAAYDHSRPLVIDPVLVYSSFLGGSQKNSLSRIAIDSAGNAYVAGFTASGDFPASPTPLATTFGGGTAQRGVFVAKIDPTGSTLLYSTYLSGSGSEQATGLALDRSGNAYVTGNTSSADFPVRNAFQSTCATNLTTGKCSNTFLTKISSTGDALLYSTYLGGTGSDSATSLAVDSQGNAHVVGITSSPDFPATAGAMQTKCGGACVQNAFLAKFNATGESLSYATYLGGSGSDSASDVALDSAGSAYVTGQTTSVDFPLANAFQKTCAVDPSSQAAGCLATAFVAKIKADGSALAYSTYLGGSLGSHGTGIAVDSLSSAYVTGSTQSADFPVLKAFQGACGIDATSGKCSVDVFLSKFNPTGNALVYSTYLGGSGRDEASGIALDAAGNAHIVGRTESADFPTAKPLQSHLNGISDAFVATFNTSGSALLFSTYHGGSSAEAGNGIALDAKGNIYIAGETSSPDFPTSHPFQSSCAGACNNAFVSKMTVPPPAILVTVAPPSASVEVSQTQIFTATVTGSVNTTVTWSLSGSVCSGNACGTLSSTSANPVTYTGPASNPTGTITLTATANADGTTTGTAAITVDDFSLGVAPASADVAPGGGTTTTLTATAVNGYTGTITPSCIGPLPTGVTCAFAPTTLTLPGTPTSTLTITTTASTPAGAHTITVKGVDSAAVPVTHTTPFMLNVVTVSVAPASRTIEVNNTQVFTATVVPAQSVTWSLSGTGCAGATCGSLSSTTTNPVTYTAPAAAPAGTVTLTATTTGGQTGTSTITVSDFSLSIAPTSADVAPGGGATPTLTASAVNGYAATVNTSCAVTPVVTNGPNCAIAASVAVPGTATVTLTTAANTPGGAYTATITATDTAAVPVTHNATFTLNVVTISVSPATKTVEVNNTQSFTATVTPVKTITWSLTGTGCSGAACGTVSPLTGASTTYTAPATAPLGTVTLTASAAGGFTGTATITVTDFSLSVNPTTKDVIAGTSATTTLTASAFNANGYAGSLTPSCVAPPAGVSCSFNPTPFTGPGTSTLTISTTGAATPGPDTITIKAVDAAGVPVSHTTTFTLNVVTITITPLSATVEVNNTKSFAGVVAGLVDTTVNWSLSGANCSGAACGTLSAATGSPVTYTAPSTATLGSVTLTATASDGLFQTATITVTDFKLAVSPLLADVAPTGTGVATPTLTVSAFNANGYSGTLTPTCVSLPANVTCSFSPTPFTGPGTSILTVTAAGATAGVYPVTLQAVDSAGVPVTHTTPFTIHVVTVVVSAPTATLEVNQTEQISATITGAPQNDSGADWSIVGTNCSGGTCGTVTAGGPGPNISPNTTTTTYSSPSSATTASGGVSVAIKATADGDNAFGAVTASFPITDYSISLPTTIPVITQNAAGTSSASSSVTATGINGYAGTIATTSCSVSPAPASAPTCSYPPPAVPPNSAGTPANVTVVTQNNTPVGLYSITATATDMANVPQIRTTPLAQSLAVQCNYSLAVVTPTFTPAVNVTVSGAATPGTNTYSIGVTEIAGGSACPFGDVSSLPVVGIPTQPSNTAGDGAVVLNPVTAGLNGTLTSTNSSSTITFEVVPATASAQFVAGGTNPSGVTVSFFQGPATGTNFVATSLLPIGLEATVPESAVAGGTVSPFPLAVSNFTQSGFLQFANVGGTSSVCGVVDKNGLSDPSNFGITCTAPASTPLPVSGPVPLSVTISATTPTTGALRLSRERKYVAALYAFGFGLPGIIFMGMGASAFGSQHRKSAFKRMISVLGILFLVLLLGLLPSCGGGIKGNPFGPPGTGQAAYTLTVMGTVTDSSGAVVGVDVFTVTLTVLAQ